MLRNSFLKLFFFTTVRKKRFLWILVTFTLLSAFLAYLGYLSIKNGLDYVPYEDMIYDTFNFIVVASIIFAGVKTLVPTLSISFYNLVIELV